MPEPPSQSLVTSHQSLLSGTVLRTFEPQSALRAAVIVPCAMGVAQNYYGRFAEWLASQGFLVATFDYRGIGMSAPRSLRGFEVDIVDWAQRDCAAVIDFVKARLPEAPLYWVGHSLGGQLLGLIPNRDRIDRVLTIATGNGYWRENSWQTKRFVWWLWFVAAPISMRLLGYFPGKRLRKVGDLPLGVMRQWRRWCLSREYVVGGARRVSPHRAARDRRRAHRALRLLPARVQRDVVAARPALAGGRRSLSQKERARRSSRRARLHPRWLRGMSTIVVSMFKATDSGSPMHGLCQRPEREIAGFRPHARSWNAPRMCMRATTRANLDHDSAAGTGAGRGSPMPLSCVAIRRSVSAAAPSSRIDDSRKAAPGRCQSR
jgi:predicted alpha/beta hydrolase